MNIYKNTAFYLLLAVLFACNDPDIIGLDLPGSARFTITNDSIDNFTIKTVSEDSLRSDESQNLLLGQINDPIFGENKGSFCTQMLLTNNNIDAINGIEVDSVFLTYSISDHYGDLNESEDLEINVYRLSEDIYKDSNYYSDESFNYDPNNLVTNYFINEGDSSTSSFINIQLDNSFGEIIMNETGGSNMIDNVAFLEFFKGLYLEATASNTILYLNPIADKSRFSIYYHEIGGDTALSFDFELGGDATRINMFNKKDINDITPDVNEIFIQSMAGYKAEFDFTNLEEIQTKCLGKSINRVTIDFEAFENNDYPLHEKLYLLRENNEGKIVFLTDFTIEGEGHFGGEFDNNTYSFNITRYFVQLLTNDQYTNKLYLVPVLGSANANRTILNKSKISINIIYTEI
ncbi:MAG: DUF4270 family protein [Flavobacteriales bacterium]|nr:DUF4270 family protein [Flavobacteriales bacterium]